MSTEGAVDVRIGEVRSHDELPVRGRLLLQEVGAHTAEVCVVRALWHVVQVAQHEVHMLPVLHQQHVGLVHEHDLHAAQKVRCGRVLLAFALCFAVAAVFAGAGTLNGEAQAQWGSDDDIADVKVGEETQKHALCGASAFAFAGVHLYANLEVIVHVLAKVRAPVGGGLWAACALFLLLLLLRLQAAAAPCPLVLVLVLVLLLIVIVIVAEVWGAILVGELLLAPNGGIGPKDVGQLLNHAHGHAAEGAQDERARSYEALVGDAAHGAGPALLSGCPGHALALLIGTALLLASTFAAALTAHCTPALAGLVARRPHQRLRPLGLEAKHHLA